jgi:hypothetical protein
MSALRELTSIAADGYSFVIGNTTGYDSVSAVPTTAGKFDFYNGDPVKNYIINKIVVGQHVVDATQANCSEILFCINPVAATVPTKVACKHTSLSGKQGLANATATGTLTNAVVGTATTITNYGWFTLPTMDDLGAVAAGSIMKTLRVDVDGMIILPPKSLISLAVLQLAAVSAACFFNIYYDEKAFGVNG